MKPNFFQMRWGALALTLSSAHVNQQSLKNWTKSTSYMWASFVDLVQESAS